MREFCAYCLLCLLLNTCHSVNDEIDSMPPNVILVMTDDQGIGDLACHGNPWLKTPHLDSFYGEAVRLTDFHVSPVCTPTRSALMTGRYPINNGAWATYKGRDALPAHTKTMADFFSEKGYRTGLFGKWHLGDNYPSRPTDCGFDLAVHHKSGGVGELSDYWGNNYFDDVYFVNNEPRQFEGYCTDVWFDEAMKFIGSDDDRPFFVYLPTNAPHSPFIVDDSYAAPYASLEGNHIVGANFYGMLANIDENFGRLQAFLSTKNLRNNTILIFMTDNGSGGGVSNDGQLGHNHGFRGKKGDKTEGGHRVPFFIHWKDGHIEGGRDVTELLAHVDLLPTLAGLCDLDLGAWQVDGIDFSGLLTGESQRLNDRHVFLHHHQDWRAPKDVDETCLMQGDWRLINGSELYNVSTDRHQDNDVADQYPERVREMLQANEVFVNRAKSRDEYREFPAPIVGGDVQADIKLTIQHAIGEAPGIWKAEHVAAGMKNLNNTHPLEILEPGRYRISCTRWPRECPGPVLGVPHHNPKGGMYEYRSMDIGSVRIKVANQTYEKPVKPEDVEIDFQVDLQQGKTLLTTDFIKGDEVFGVYYTYIERMGVGK